MRTGRRKVENTKCDFLCAFAWRPAMRKCENAKMKDKITTLSRGVFSRGDLSPRQAKTRQIEGENSPLINVSYLRLAGRKVARRKPATWWLFRVFAWRPFAPPGKDTKTGGDKAKHEKFRTFVWRGERSPCENTKKWPFGGVSRGDLSPFRPENTIIRHGTNQPP